MHPSTSQMHLESHEAPDRVRDVLTQDESAYASLGQRLRALKPAVVTTIARGSSDHAAAYAAYLIPLCTGRVVASLPPSVVTVLNASLRLQGQVALAISQGGGSPDIIKTQARCRDAGALTVALVNTFDSPLGGAAEICLPQRAGAEKSITATKSVLCSMAGVARLTAEWAEDQALLEALTSLPTCLAAAAQLGEAVDDQLLTKVRHVFVISRGLGHCAALELALKLKETCGIHAEAFSTAEVRHGPREVVNKEYLIIALALPGSGEADVLAAAQELGQQGARVLVLGRPGPQTTFSLPQLADARLAPLVSLQVLYPWIARSALRLGRDPDRPKTLVDKVIKTV